MFFGLLIWFQFLRAAVLQGGTLQNQYQKFLVPQIYQNAEFFFSNETDCERTPDCRKANRTSKILQDQE